MATKLGAGLKSLRPSTRRIIQIVARCRPTKTQQHPDIILFLTMRARTSEHCQNSEKSLHDPLSPPDSARSKHEQTLPKFTAYSKPDNHYLLSEQMHRWHHTPRTHLVMLSHLLQSKHRQTI